MVLVDTSVWVDHFRKYDSALELLLNENAVSIHPFVLGELACGNFKNRHLIISLLQVLPSSTIVSQTEYLHIIEKHKLWGTGLGFVDIHLLASSRIHNCLVYSHDKVLSTAASRFNICYRRSA